MILPNNVSRSSQASWTVVTQIFQQEVLRLCQRPRRTLELNSCGPNHETLSPNSLTRPFNTQMFYNLNSLFLLQTFPLPRSVSERHNSSKRYFAMLLVNFARLDLVRLPDGRVTTQTLCEAGTLSPGQCCATGWSSCHGFGFRRKDSDAFCNCVWGYGMR